MVERKFLSSLEALGLSPRRDFPSPEAEGIFGGLSSSRQAQPARRAGMLTGLNPPMFRWGSRILGAVAAAPLMRLPPSAIVAQMEQEPRIRFDFREVTEALDGLVEAGLLRQDEDGDGNVGYALTPIGQSLA